ncbi:NAD(+) synthase [Intestinibacillus massiliensis]|uniref:NAD(+) synthase n=1 Tax=Intestinibacillus massiliensis TaxID=1871029 RepID=UPI000B34C3C9|nr:NAD(+) synthase [Intestinibacillus massiliensis]
MKDGFIKVASATPAIRVADCAYNASEIIRQARQAAEKGAQLVVFPELCLTGYTCGDLFLHETLLRGALDALGTVCAQTTDLNAALVVGLPFAFGGKLYNCAAVVCAGRIAGLVPKQNIPNYAEFYEARHFAPGVGLEPAPAKACGQDTVFGTGLLFQCPELPALTLGVEICEDLWVPDAPSAALAQMGATVIANPSASDEVVGKAAYRRDLVRGQSARLLCAYVYADAGFGESTQDLVFAGHNLIAENGALLTESRRFESGLCYADVDLGRLVHERRRMNTFETMEAPYVAELRLEPLEDDLADRYVPATPFVPTDKGALEERCQEILTMQATGLATRLRHARCKDAVIGLSGGLDSTLALVVTVHAFDMLGLDRSGILAVTMPCFGTTARTKGNAEKLAEAYGATLRVVDIKAAVDQHFADIGHAKDDLNVTFENGQARMRTLVLMDLANEVGGLVVGTGDLSELALGWATYNGDHMSMYGVNASIPKTLVRYLTAFEASRSGDGLREILLDVLGTPVSPELLPPKDGEIAQKTEELVGPYELHDFYLYYMLRWGYSPRKVFRVAQKAFAGQYDGATIKKWLVTFLRRFFSQQFKRSCLPDGPKVGTVTLSPRGDWRMPSDAVSALWLAEAEAL